MNVIWSNYAISNPPKASRESIEKAEKELGVKLPADFLAIAAVHQGAAPDPESFDLPDGTGSSFSHLFHFVEEYPISTNNIVAQWSSAFAVPDKVIPFAKDGGGNLLCFDYRETPDHPPVVFWDHEHCDDPPQLLASSFTDLLNKLYDDPD